MALDMNQIIDTAREALTQRERLIDTAKLVRRKFPALREGLKTLGKKDKHEALSIGHFLEKNAREQPAGTALLFEDQRFTNRQLHEHSNRYANMFAAHGIRKGDAVALLLENRPEIIFAVAGAVKLGAIASVINTQQRKKVLLHSFGLCNARLFVVGEELLSAFQEVRKDLPVATEDAVIYLRDDGKAKPPSDMIDGNADLEKASTATPAAMRSVTLGDPCFYIYTSGTTGLPKASIMSHFRWVKASGAFGKLALDMKSSDTIYVPLPFYHNNALTVAWSSAASAGAALAMRRKFSASSFWNDTRKFNATTFCYIGELCRYLMNQPPLPDDGNNPVIKCIGNGLRPDIWKEFKSRFRIEEVYEFYAASEGNIAFVNVFNLDCTVGFCPAPYALVKYDIDRDEPVRGPDGFLIRAGFGEIGLLVGEVSEKYAFDGYTDKTANEKKLLRDVFEPGDLWFNSGDLLRDQGFRHAQFVDRVGDTFRWKSENVSTNEVAEVLDSYHQIHEATVYGVQIPGTEGRAGMAAIVPSVSEDKLDLKGIARHVASELPHYARPIFLRVQGELEVTGTFKQKKTDLKSQGYDPAAAKESIYAMLPRTNEYVKVTPEIVADITGGKIAF